MRTHPFALLCLAALALAGCDEPEAPAGLIKGTPEGGLFAWLGEIRTGLDSVPALVRATPAAAQERVLTLYVTRQEYLEMYFGEGGRLKATEELATAIMEQEERFHTLMQLLIPEAPDVARVDEAVDALRRQAGRVDAAARASGAALDPWSEAGS
jgi:hypothetical protein